MIQDWLQKFESSWKNHDIDQVLGLFDEKVVYWESPFRKLRSIEDIKNEWSVIKNQFDIRLTTSVYSEENGRYSVKWNVFYRNESHQEKQWAGIYLVELSDSGKCMYFYQVGEPVPR